MCTCGIDMATQQPMPPGLSSTLPVEGRDDGLVDEVTSLLEHGLREGVTASRAIGYAQVLAALDGEYDLAQAEELTFIGTRRYVRRQRSWFRRDHRAQWLDAAAPDLLDRALRIVDAPSP